MEEVTKRERGNRKPRGRSTSSARKENTVDAGIGIDDHTAASAEARANALIEAQRGSRLAISETESASFSQVTIPASEIMEKTYVHHANLRDQEMLTDVTCADIISSLSPTGNVELAKGFYDEQGRICIIAGSRRRFSCHTEQVPYNVLVTNQILTEDQCEFLTQISDTYDQPGIIERAQVWLKAQDSKKLDQKAIAKQFTETEATVSVGIRAITLIPRDILLHMPAAPKLGVPSLKLLIAAFEPLKGDKLNAALEACLAIDKHQIYDSMNSPADEKWNGAMVKKIVAECRKALKKKAPAKPKPVTWKDPSLNGTECVVTESSKGTVLTLKQFSDTKRSMILKAAQRLSEAESVDDAVLQNLYADLKQLVDD